MKISIEELRNRKDQASDSLKNIREQQKQLVSYEAQLIGRVQTYEELIAEEEQNAQEEESGLGDPGQEHQDKEE